MTTVNLKYIREDEWGRPVFETRDGKIFKDVNNLVMNEQLTNEFDEDNNFVNHGLCTATEVFGEPCSPVNPKLNYRLLEDK